MADIIQILYLKYIVWSLFLLFQKSFHETENTEYIQKHFVIVSKKCLGFYAVYWTIVALLSITFALFRKEMLLEIKISIKQQFIYV